MRRGQARAFAERPPRFRPLPLVAVGPPTMMDHETVDQATASLIADGSITKAAIRMEALTKRYGKTVGVEHLDLEVPAGTVFGYLGPNGAGKTTTIRLLVGMLRPSSGRAEVLGMDVVGDRERVDASVGYLPGYFVGYRDMTGAQYLQYLSSLRGVDARRNITMLAERLDVDLQRRIAELSHGNRQKVGVIQAFMHDPEVLILDEPTTGLDPLIQREFLGMLKEARTLGKTVFLSSHILAEVEAVADIVAILRKGRLVVVAEIERLKARALHRLDLTFLDDAPLEILRQAPGVLEVEASNRTVHLVVEGSAAEVLKAAAPFGIDKVRSYEADLEEIFMSYYTG